MSRGMLLLFSSLCLFLAAISNNVAAFSLPPPTSSVWHKNARHSASSKTTRLYVSTSVRPNRQEYQILGVSSDASMKEIKTAYRKLAKQYHPDANPDEDTTEQFQVINTAYETLKELIENPPPEPKGWKGNVSNNNGSPFNGNTSPFGTVDYDSPYGNSRASSSPFNGGGFGDSSRSGASPYGYGCYSNPSASPNKKATTTQTNSASHKKNGQSQQPKNGSFYGGKPAESFYTGKVGDSSYDHSTTYSADTTIKSPFAHAKKHNSKPPPPPPDTAVKNPFGSGPAAGTKRTIQSPFDKGPTTRKKQTVSPSAKSKRATASQSPLEQQEEKGSFYGGKTAESFYTGKVSDASYDHSTTYSGDTKIKSPFNNAPPTKKKKVTRPRTSNPSHTHGPKRQVPKAARTPTRPKRSNMVPPPPPSSHSSTRKQSSSNTASAKASHGYTSSFSNKPKAPDFTTGSSFNKKIKVPKPASSRPAASTVKPPSPPHRPPPRPSVQTPKGTSGSPSSTYSSKTSSSAGSTVGRTQGSSSNARSTTSSNSSTSSASSAPRNVNTTPPPGVRNGPSTVPPKKTFTRPPSTIEVKRSTPSSKRPDLGNTSYVKGSVMMGRSSNRPSSHEHSSYSGTGVGSKEVARPQRANDSVYSGTGAGSIEVARPPLRDPRRIGPVEVGNDIRHDLEIDFDMAVFGGERTIRFRRLEACGNCLASGVRPGSKKQSCNACGGVICMTPSAFQDPVCSSCDGTGLQKRKSCRKCKGNGVRKRRMELTVNVPQNVEEGNWVRIPGEGDAGTFGGPPGDLYVFLTVKNVPSGSRRRRILNKTWRPLSRFAGRQVQRAKRIDTRPISNFAGKQWHRLKQVDVRPVSRFAGKQWQRVKGAVRRRKQDDEDGPDLRP